MKLLSKLKGWDRIEVFLIIVILVLFALAPVYIRSPFYLNMVVVTIIYAYMSTSWNILGGFAGQLFIGGGVIFFGIGAYTSTILLVRYGVNPWIGMAASALVCTIFAFLLAKLTLRYSIRGDYLALFSVALSQALALVFINSSWLGGSFGFMLPMPGNTLASMSWSRREPFVYLALAMLTLNLILVYYLKNIKLGKYWVAIRENDVSAEALGIDTARYKTLAMLLCGALGGMGGTLYAQYTTYIEPHLVFGLPLNFEFILPVLIGGKGTVLGPLLGASILKPLSELVRTALGQAQSSLYLMVYGALLVIFIINLPQGVVGAMRNWYEKRRFKKNIQTADMPQKGRGNGDAA